MNKREVIISNYIKSPTGRAALAASMMQPLRTRLEYREPSIELISRTLVKEEDMKQYICWYIKQYKRHDNLRTAIKQTCPDKEVVLDKLLILR